VVPGSRPIDRSRPRMGPSVATPIIVSGATSGLPPGRPQRRILSLAFRGSSRHLTIGGQVAASGWPRAARNRHAVDASPCRRPLQRLRAPRSAAGSLSTSPPRRRSSRATLTMRYWGACDAKGIPGGGRWPRPSGCGVGEGASGCCSSSEKRRATGRRSPWPAGLRLSTASHRQPACAGDLACCAALDGGGRAAPGRAPTKVGHRQADGRPHPHAHDEWPSDRSGRRFIRWVHRGDRPHFTSAMAEVMFRSWSADEVLRTPGSWLAVQIEEVLRVPMVRFHTVEGVPAVFVHDDVLPSIDGEHRCCSGRDRSGGPRTGNARSSRTSRRRSAATAAADACLSSPAFSLAGARSAPWHRDHRRP
jgi:hypothetical protein